MYQTIREYQTDPKSTDEILRVIEKSFVPFITNAPGFREYHCIDSGNGHLTSTSLFANRSDGDQFNKLAIEWVQQNLKTLLPNSPKVTSGEVRVHASGKIAVA